MDLLYFRKFVLLATVAVMDGLLRTAGDLEICADGASNYTIMEREHVKVSKYFTTYRILISKLDCVFLREIFFNKSCERARIVSYSALKYDVIVSITNMTKCCPGFLRDDDKCVKVCPVGHFGSNCTYSCMCQNNSTCDAATGRCNCSAAPGWTGSFCGKECDTGSFGMNCQHICTCSENQTCDQLTGRCTCMSGLIGPNCTEAEPNHPDTVKSNNFPTGELTGGVIGVIVLGVAVVITVFVTRRLLRREAQGHNDERENTNPGGAATQPGLYETLNTASMEERDRDTYAVLFTTGQAGVPGSDNYENIITNCKQKSNN